MTSHKHFDPTFARIVDAAAADSRALAVNRPRIQFPELSGTQCLALGR
jgi:hypothetical protein